MGDRKATSHPGVRYRSHPLRKHGIQFDRYFSIRHFVNGRRIEEAAGWSSEGWTAAKAADVRAELQRNKTLGTGPRTLAEKRALEENSRHQAELTATAEAMTLADYWPTYLSQAEKIKKNSSWSKEAAQFRLWIEPVLGQTPLRQIDIQAWDRLVATLGGKSKRYVEYITGTLRRILKHAHERGLVDSPPPSGKRIGVTGPGQSNRRLRVITPAEATAILDELAQRDPAGWRIVRAAFLTGARASELFNLKWCDIDRARGVVRFSETKNRDSRELPLHPALVEIIEQIPEGESDQRVFTREDGRPYTEAPGSFREAVKRLKMNHGRGRRDRLSFHSIRHSVATELAQSLNLRDLMDVMGWRTVIMAVRYVHSNVQAKETALGRLVDKIQPPPKSTVIPFRLKPEVNK